MGSAAPPVVTAAPTDARVTGPDETFMLVEALAGVETPIQMGWVFATDPGEQAVARIHARLAAGPVHRAIATTRVPFARHRWVAAGPPEPMRADVAAVAPERISRWFADHLDSTSVRPTRGRSWHVATAPTTDGGRVVSVLASHVVCDGSGLRRALLADAMPVGAGSLRGGVADDLRDAGGQLVAALRAVARLAASAVTGLRSRRDGVPDGPAVVDLGRPSPARPLPRPTSPDPDPPVRHLLVTLDADALAARAAEHGGTVNTLFCALIGGIAQRAGIPDDDTTAICIAVNRRAGDDDARANASGGVWIRTRGGLDGPVDLTGMRSQTRRALAEYAERGAEMSADNVQPVVRLLPSRAVLALTALIPSPHTTVSNLGAVEPDLLRMGGQTAHVQFTRAAVRGMSADDRRRRCRPGLLAWLTHHGDTATMAVCGVDPDRFGAPEVLRDLVEAQLDAWDLPHAVL
ncbi:hypothetical protein [Williamsia serinedens]|uniref:Diacylglycerol O-acyltransferase n=1 Tax=Williamsia serinedens TaxID=391736 RepID=A0ABT1GZC1_9NOCA|nr:hypothetical protein [Williamsia serinedens]MCP2160301.1 hypothetical protein [Williamsia serinedens]